MYSGDIIPPLHPHHEKKGNELMDSLTFTEVRSLAPDHFQVCLLAYWVPRQCSFGYVSMQLGMLMGNDLSN